MEELPDIRPARVADHPAIVSLWHQGWHLAHGQLIAPEFVAVRTVESFSIRLDGLIGSTLVTISKGRIAGFTALAGCEVDQFYIAPEFHGQGIAQGLMQAAEAALAGQAITNAVVDCVEGNHRAYRFYEKSGWVDAALEAHDIWMPDAAPIRCAVHRFTKHLAPASTDVGTERTP